MLLLVNLCLNEKMIVFHLIYLNFYIACKKIANKWVYDTPETYAIGFTGFLYGMSGLALIHRYLPAWFELVSPGAIAIGLLVINIAIQYWYYVAKKAYLDLESRIGYKSLFFLPVTICIIYAVYRYMRYHYLNHQP